MRCPYCRVELEGVECETISADAAKVTVHLDRCSRCEGLWFDRGELSAFTGADLTGHSLAERTAALFPRCHGCGADNAQEMTRCVSCHSNLRYLCPHCRTGLEHANFLGFYIDYCARCYGMWLSKSAVTAIATAAHPRPVPELEPQPQPQPETKTTPASAPIAETPDTPDNLTCAHCGATGLTLRNSFCSADGPICEECFGADENLEEDVASWFPTYDEGRGGLIEIISIIGQHIRTRMALKRLAEEE